MQVLSALAGSESIIRGVVVEFSLKLTKFSHILLQTLHRKLRHAKNRLIKPDFGVRDPALKISWGPPTANLWPDWSPQKRVNCNKLDQRQKMRKSRFNHQFCSKTCFNHQYCTKINYFFIIQCFI